MHYCSLNRLLLLKAVLRNFLGSAAIVVVKMVVICLSMTLNIEHISMLSTKNTCELLVHLVL